MFAAGFLHRGTRSAIELAGGPGFIDGEGPPLFRLRIKLGSKEYAFSDAQMVWERALGWLPTFTWTMGEVVVRGTIFAPFGRDSDAAGAVYALSVENRSAAKLDVVLIAEGTLGHRQLRVRTERAFEPDSHRVEAIEGDVVLGGKSPDALVALAIGADGDSSVTVDHAKASTYLIRRALSVESNGRAQSAFYIAAGPEPDGARASMTVLRRRGWKDLLRETRDALKQLEQSTGQEQMDALINRHLLFAYFYGIGRALDDAHFYLVRTRVPWHSHGVTVRDWEALMWTLPAIQLADAPLARELLLRACEVHGYAPGRGVHYFDGTMFAPGFSLEGAAVYALAVDRYIRDTNDDQIVEEPVLADTLYLTADDLAERRDRNVPLYTTEIALGGGPAPQPFTLHGNAVVAQAFEILRRTLDEDTARDLEDPEAIRAAVRRHFVMAEAGGKQKFVSATDLAGHGATDDDPVASMLWLPLYDAVERSDSTYRRTVKGIVSTPSELAHQCARLLGPESTAVLEWFRRAPLDGGYAAEIVTAEGAARYNGGDASLSGLLAWCAWYAVHALGERP
ncbi:MAG TPA: hypothetical protein VF483_11915 [Gemmatimonadaceae bacterium]